jgi:NAD(P)-dependent dehydrogenase (short-subunit alcohol dehydrogenase family)
MSQSVPPRSDRHRCRPRHRRGDRAQARRRRDGRRGRRPRRGRLREHGDRDPRRRRHRARRRRRRLRPGPGRGRRRAGGRRAGRADVLVNNAGVLRDNLLFKMSEDDWETVMAVHLRGAFLFSRAVQKHMVDAGWGRIVSLSSTSALGNRGQANYAAAKAGMQGFTKTLAIELGRSASPRTRSRPASSSPT